MSGRHVFVGLVLVACVAMVVAGAASGVASATCGSVITENTTLTANLKDCANGLTIGAPGVTLDLNGHTIKGTGSGVGILFAHGAADGATVTNGSVKGFGVGIAGDASEATIGGMTLTENGSGIAPSDTPGSERWSIVDNTIRDNTGDGIVEVDHDRDTIANNRITHNGGNGIQILHQSDHTTVSNNVISHNALNGVRSDTSIANFFSNTLNDNGEYGLWFRDLCFDDFINASRIGGNTANHNGALGIGVFGEGLDCEPFPSTPDLDDGGNAAKNNGNPLQCTVVVCARKADDD